MAPGSTRPCGTESHRHIVDRLELLLISDQETDIVLDAIGRLLVAVFEEPG
jgi:hypothetical protein